MDGTARRSAGALHAWTSAEWLATFVTLSIVAACALALFSIFLLLGDASARAALWVGWPSAVAAVIVRSRYGPSPLA